MKKEKFEVVRPWQGVSAGQIIELAVPIHPAIEANVRKVVAVEEGFPAAELVTAALQAEQIITEATQAAADLVNAAKLEAEQIVTDATAQGEAAKLQAEQIVGDAYTEAEKIKTAAAGKK